MSAHLDARFRLQRGNFRLDVALQVGMGCTGVVGASGCGKTTLLRCLAGLERAEEGMLRVGEMVWQDRRTFVPAHQRSVGYVFQEQALFPHLNVRGNLMFGFARVPASQRKVSLNDAVALLGLETLIERRTDHLSGGERQRVAIARAVLTSPQLLLLDEPLASLDGASRAQILPYLEAVRRSLDIPMLYVTHAPTELTHLAEEVVYLEAGQVRAVGPINEILTRPDLPLSHIEDAGAVLEARVSQHLEGFHLTQLEVAGGTLLIAQRSQLSVGHRTRVHIRARDVSVCLDRPQRTSISNVLAAQVAGVHTDSEPAHRLVQLEVGGTKLLARVTAQSVQQLQLAAGQHVFAQVKSVALVE